MLKFLHSKFYKDLSATAAIEFAILLPLLLIMFFGAFEVSRYILVVRKVENTTSDIGFLLSREGTVHDINGDGSVSSTSEDEKRIERIANALVPATMYPYKYDNYQVEVRTVARPVGASLAPNNARVMWAHKIDRASGTKPASLGANGFSVTASTTTVSGSSAPSSIYSDDSGNRAELTFEGQTFLMVNMAYGYNQIINNFVNFVNLNFEDNDIEKISSYAVRSRWIDNGDGNIQANEYYNEMQTCTRCNVLTSNTMSSGTGRQACETNPGSSGYASTSGCKFK